VGLPILLTLLAGAGVVLGSGQARLLGGIALVLLVLMAGPYLIIGGTAGAPETAVVIKLPFYYLGELPVGSVFRFPFRLFPWALIAVMFAAGDTLLDLRGRKMPAWAVRLLLPAVLLISLLENRVVFADYGRFALTQPRIPSFYQQGRPARHAALLHLPARPRIPNAYLYHGYASERPQVNGYLHDGIALEVPTASAPAEQKRAFFRALWRMGVGHIVVHFDQLRGGESFAWLEAFCGAGRPYHEDRMVVFRVPDGALAPR